MARKKKPSITPVAPQKTENQPTQAPSQQTPQAPSGGQSSISQAPSTPQKS